MDRCGEPLTLKFVNTVKIVGFHFWDKDHGGADLNSGDKFGLKIDAGATQALNLDHFPWYGAVKIAAVTPVPEPQTYALMLAGLGAIGFVARRRRATL